MAEVTTPEWIESQGKLIDGLDLLGLRLPVQLISGSLLNGVTTISPRVRYLSIRSWIIKAFSESKLPNDPASFNDFAGRVEAALAIGMLLVDRNAIYIPGSEKGRSIIDGDVEPVSIKRLLTQTAVNAYTGPSFDLFISFYASNGVTGLTKERGEPLALEFEKLIRETRFFEAMKQNPLVDSISRDILLELGNAIQLNDIPDTERDLLLDAIIPTKPQEKAMLPLRKEVYRLGVYTYLLELAKRFARIPREADIFEIALHPEPLVTDTLTPILDGYLLYRIRDILAVVHEAVLGEVCLELGVHEEAVTSTQVIRSLLNENINDALRKVELLTSEESYVSIRYLDLYTRVSSKIGETTIERGLYRWFADLDESVIIETVLRNKATAVGLQPVAWILCQLRIGSYDLMLFPELEILSRQGQARIGMKQVVLQQHNVWMDENPTLEHVIAWQIQRTVDQHLRIAWSRMFNDVDKDVAILTSDGELWFKRGKSYVGGRTASRISQAIGWLKQLKLVEKNGLTPAGELTLLRGYEVLANCRGDA